MQLGSTSIIIPTYREVANLPTLITQLAELQNEFSYFEVIIVDDHSLDGTIEYIQDRQRLYHWLKFINRQESPDLSQAVLTGLRSANGENLVVMDADLSHPVATIPKLIAALCEPDVDFVIGSRYIPGASIDKEWSIWRRWNAGVAKWLAGRLVTAHDPLSGFFCLRKDKFTKAQHLNPIGYKIGLELLVKCHCQSIREIPINFADRHIGKSKLNFKQQLNYLWHIKRLYNFRRKHVGKIFN